MCEWALLLNIESLLLLTNSSNLRRIESCPLNINRLAKKRRQLRFAAVCPHDTLTFPADFFCARAKHHLCPLWRAFSSMRCVPPRLLW